MLVRVFLKGGQTVEFKCEKTTFNYDQTSLEYTGYAFEGLKGFKKVSFVPSQISGYTVR